MKRTLVFITVTLSIAALALAGEQIRERRGGESDLGQYLQLTAAQQTAWESARRDFRDGAKALFERQEQLGQQAEAALKEKSADACAIGSLMIAQQAVNDQIRSARQSMMQKFESVLTPEQKTKYEAFKAARPFERERE
jgi:Spy/CpxP family protein refolding chaperone